MPSHPKDRHTVMYIVSFIDVTLTVSSRKYTPFFAHYFEAKLGRGICLNINFVSCRCPSHHSSHNCNDYRSFLDERQRRWTCTQEISGACVETKPRGIEATCINRGRLHTSSRFQCEQQKPLAEASEWGYSINFLFVHIYKHKQWRLKPKRCSIRGVHIQEKYLCKNLGLRKRVFAQMGHIFGTLL